MFNGEAYRPYRLRYTKIMNCVFFLVCISNFMCFNGINNNDLCLYCVLFLFTGIPFFLLFLGGLIVLGCLIGFFVLFATDI
ncbi:MAG: hypothetical protein LBH59_03340 [Planctomycetaceae bacterium]|nr:hypothetical protein [Planctomycetaceae bacterium]